MISREPSAAKGAGVRLEPGHIHWPPLWREMSDPPTGITVTGQCAALGRQALAIVGTRRATPRGLAVAEGLAAALADAGWVIVSGLAYGIDAAAHRGALAAGGVTVAIMGTGSDRTYPSRHVSLRERIEQKGCCVSELPAGAPPLRHHFPQRNRLIAGLVEGVIVVEAPLHSGALVTAYLALDLCREVCAVPGPIDVPQYHGCFQLLREGATLVAGVADVHAALAPPGGRETRGIGADTEPGDSFLPPVGSVARWIWDHLDLEGVTLGDLRRRWRGAEASWAEGILALEMRGLIRRLPGRKLARSIWRTR
jgi:DNA processing protein